MPFSFSRKVIIWKEVSGKWQKIYEWSDHEASVNSICWAPHQFGLILACASTDTTISLLTYVPETNAWTSRKILKAHDQVFCIAPIVRSELIAIKRDSFSVLLSLAREVGSQNFF